MPTLLYNYHTNQLEVQALNLELSNSLEMQYRPDGNVRTGAFLQQARCMQYSVGLKHLCN